MYREDEKFADSRNCPNCHRLLGQKIARVWQAVVDATGMSIQWECETCHCRSFEYLSFAEYSAAEDLGTCDFCTGKFPVIIWHRGQPCCERCAKIIDEMYSSEGGE